MKPSSLWYAPCALVVRARTSTDVKHSIKVDGRARGRRGHERHRHHAGAQSCATRGTAWPVARAAPLDGAVGVGSSFGFGHFWLLTC